MPWLLALLEDVYATMLELRRWLYARGWKQSGRLPVPVLVVGNVSVGGTGKTPLTAWLVAELAARGWRPGIVLRGYGGRERGVALVHASDSAARVGDEALLLARAGNHPVAIGRRRYDAGRALLEQAGCDLVICDDGLQHWSLARDLEIAVVDGERRFGNGRLLPAGPLREPIERLARVDLVVVNGGPGQGREVPMRVSGARAVSLLDPTRQVELSDWRGETVHAVAGIGQPERFFGMLERQGLTVIRHPLPDHHHFDGSEFNFDDGLRVLVTEKDAVKCVSFADDRCFAVPVDVTLPEGFADDIHRRLKRCASRPDGGLS